MWNFKNLLSDRTKALIFKGRKCTNRDTSWIGGNAPAYFDDQKDFQSKYGSTYYFFLSLVNPLDPTMMFTIFFPREYDEYLDNNKYPTCTILLVEHPVAHESSTDVFTNPNMKKYAIGNCEVINNDTSDNQTFLVKFGGTPEHIQNKRFYTKELVDDSFEFLFQIDEQGYPEEDDFIKGNYPFSYGAIYIYAQIKMENITNPVVGYWQFS
ncbi:hypothetical protein AMS59_11240 [Lysinibacillus sp. FJAT-14745]|uniref:hypothetical protein n=1 Tax=Lysinibacillus sp. FJAT-14745 TaxID=1704289 RepID=UPI0006AB9312|nr:hypothetical protein [Lysinibacillus sp. FJAT-14745]KOP78429.1 hypothetical protein AMS59_11240 [Lysinibacillus sp. FJAT-14745]